MIYDFDEIIDRAGTNSLTYDGWKAYLFPNDPDLNIPYADHELIRLWVADMAFSSPPPVLDAIRARLDQKILGYSKIYDSHYGEVLQRWFAANYDWNINTEELVSAPGIVTALYRLVPLLAKADEQVLITTPSYGPFKKAGDQSGREVLCSSLLKNGGRYEMDFADIKQQIMNPANRIRIFILCHPYNPTGRVWTVDELTELGKLCLANDVWIISDEVHSDLLRAGQKHVPIAALFPDSDRIITCSAASKSFNLAGNMLSHVFIKHTAMRTQWKRLYNDYHSPLSIVATQAAYEHGAEWLKQLNQYIDNNLNFLKELITEHLPKAHFSIPEATYLAWIDLSDYVPQRKEIARWSVFFAQNAGVLIEDEAVFVSNAAGHIRINVACPRNILHEALVRMAKALNH
ncbi:MULTISPECIES: MalY/PatB family protein [Sphingobacterium]|uniref:cysteine-S-conjugate beta-lyase n=1 Tax=Sphingobacterium populi TaxID=1812824 RepID=A0ABW5U8B2_9SPHI|nr:PatB family C-S lyase [Sphingobacterium sp. CFCC 11742]